MAIKLKYQQFIADHVISADVSYRGGALKVDVSELFPSIESGDAIMGASQNYLGGGIAGSISGGAMFTPDELKTKKERLLFARMLEECKRYFYSLNEGGGDEYMHENVTGPEAGGYARTQSMPGSGY